MRTQQHVNGKLTFSIIFPWPVSQNIMCIVVAVARHRKSRCYMKTKATLIVMKRTLLLCLLLGRGGTPFYGLYRYVQPPPPPRGSACSWLVFQNVLTAISWSKQLVWSHYTLLWLQIQSAHRSAVYKMKIEPAMISFTENTTSSKMVDQCGPKKKRKKDLSLFS